MQVPMAAAEQKLRSQIARWIRTGNHGRIDCRCPECAQHDVAHASWLASMSKLAEMIENGEDIPILDVKERL